MSGWLLISGLHEDGFDRINLLKNLVCPDNNLPDQFITKSFGKYLMMASWTWSPKSRYSKPIVVEEKNNNNILILDGIITGLGKFCKKSSSSEGYARQIPNLWKQYGYDILPEINGSFALVIYDKGKRTTTCITDRISSRTIWYAREGKKYYFGNFPFNIAVVMKSAPSLDAASLWSLFSTSRPIGDRSLYAGIRCLPAGTLIEFGEDRRNKKFKWFDLRYKPEEDRSPADWGNLLTEKLLDSADRISKQSPNAYLFLSGGMDSRVAAAIFGSKVKTLTLTTHHNMNSRIAEKVADKLNIDHKTILRDPYWYMNSNNISALIASGRYNIRHSHFIPAVQKIAANEPDAVFLLGDFLENFNKHYFKPVFRNADEVIPERMPFIFNRLYSYSHKNSHELKRLFCADIGDRCSQLWSDEIIEIAREVRLVSGDTEDYLDALFRWFNVNYCPTFMMHESIKPFAGMTNLIFDNDLLDILTRIPAHIKGKGILHNEILKQINRELIRIPNSNDWLPPMWPDLLKKITKQLRPVIGRTRRRVISFLKGRPVVRTEGSWHMPSIWYRNDKKYRNFIEKNLFSEKGISKEIFSKAQIQTIWEEFLAGNNDRIFEIDVLLSFALLNNQIPTCGIALE